MSISLPTVGVLPIDKKEEHTSLFVIYRFAYSTPSLTAPNASPNGIVTLPTLFVGCWDECNVATKFCIVIAPMSTYPEQLRRNNAALKDVPSKLKREECVGRTAQM